jgi:hypothetical protein
MSSFWKMQQIGAQEGLLKLDVLKDKLNSLTHFKPQLIS